MLFVKPVNVNCGALTRSNLIKFVEIQYIDSYLKDPFGFETWDLRMEQSDKPNPLGRTEIDPLNRVNHDADCCVNPRTHRTILEVSGSDGDESVRREE